MNSRSFAVLAGISYLVIFFAAIFANFFVLESIQQSPLETVQEKHMMVRYGTMAFMITVLFDVLVAWALYELYKSNMYSGISTLFRMMHAAIMGVAIYALVLALKETTVEDVLKQVDTFNTIWLIGLFFFGMHLIFLGKILNKPKIIAVSLFIAGVAYMLDTTAHFILPNYDDHASIFLAIVAIPSILGEMSFSVWLLVKGGKE